MPPKRRRQQGTGSVYQRASDGRWIGAIYAGYTRKGAPRRITVSCSAAEGEAVCKRLLAEKQKELIRKGNPFEGIDPRTTVKQWSQTWLANTVTQVRPKTWVTNEGTVKRWIVPTIGHKRLSALTPADIRAVSQAIRATTHNGRQLSTSTALRAHVNLIQMLRAAMLEGHQIDQRVLLVEAPGKAVSDRTAIVLSDALAILREAAKHPDGSRWAAALLQGERQGECLGLTWPYVNFDRGQITWAWQLQALPYAHGCLNGVGQRTCAANRAGSCPKRFLRVPDGYEHKQLDGALCLVRPKSAAGSRITPMVPWMSRALLHWREIAPASPHGLVWPRPDGSPRRPSADRAEWNALQVAAGVSSPNGRLYVEHEARHTTATLLLESGTDPKVVAAIMGHSKVLTTQIYQHVSHDLAMTAMSGIAEMLELTDSASHGH